MRIPVNPESPTEMLDSMTREGTAVPVMAAIRGALTAESACFLDPDGCRAATTVVDVGDFSRLPSLVEPFLPGFSTARRCRVDLSVPDLVRVGQSGPAMEPTARVSGEVRVRAVENTRRSAGNLFCRCFIPLQQGVDVR